MNNKIADILADKISGLSWVDKLAGLVQTAQISVGDPKIIKRFPISCNMKYLDICKTGIYDELFPNSRYKSVIYFEDGGCVVEKSQGERIYFISRLRLVCWLNTKSLHIECSESYLYIIDLFKVLNISPFNLDYFIGVDIVITSEAVRDSTIFSKYTYDEKRTQYLLYPFDFFALDIQVKFALTASCFEDIDTIINEC